MAAASVGFLGIDDNVAGLEPSSLGDDSRVVEFVPSSFGSSAMSFFSDVEASLSLDLVASASCFKS